MTQMYCIIPMTALRASPYSLTYNLVVKAIAQAQNANGWSTASTANTAGALIQTEPTQMTAPVKGASTSQT